MFTRELNRTARGKKKLNEYKYYIEHMYGKRGKKTDYTPWGCNKLANKNSPGTGEIHGCPFKYYSDEALAKSLKRIVGDNEKVTKIIA